MGKWKVVFEEVRKNRPSKEMLFEYKFLLQENTRIVKNSQQEMLVVAEDRWGENYGMCLVVVQSGKVYVADMENYEPCTYCAKSFAQFVRISEKYWEVVEREVDKSDAVEVYRKQETQLRKAIKEIDKTALEREEYFWSVITEEVGYGM